MVSLWYPTRTTAGYSLASYMPAGAAKLFVESVLGPIGLADRVDLHAVRSNAWHGAPVAVDDRPWPVILFSPGGSLPRAMGTMLVEDMASHGFIVVTIDHTYETTVVEFPDGRLAVRTLPETDGLVKRMIDARVQDARFVLNQLELWRDGRPAPWRAALSPMALALHWMSLASACSVTRPEASRLPKSCSSINECWRALILTGAWPTA